MKTGGATGPRGPRGPADFSARVYSVVGRIPPGWVATYGDVAALAGRPGAARAVGQLMRSAARPGLPYHRVVAAHGRLGGYGISGATMKAALLRAEGLAIHAGRVLDFRKVRFRANASRTERHRLGD